MTEQASLEQFQADMYMKVMEDLAPIIRDAIDQVEAVRSAAQDAMADLSMVKRQLDQLDRVVAAGTGNPAGSMRDAITIDLLVKKQMRGSFVYFIEAGAYIKIGVSRDPIIRLGQIRQGRGITAPEGLTTSHARLLAVEQGDRTSERTLHQRFSEHRVEGEWFEKNDRLTHYIKSLATPA